MLIADVARFYPGENDESIRRMTLRRFLGLYVKEMPRIEARDSLRLFNAVALAFGGASDDKGRQILESWKLLAYPDAGSNEDPGSYDESWQTSDE